jgi:5-enolpyruvylshikimate-3-phosphate synthase
MFVEIVDNEKIINVRPPISKSYAIRYAMAALLADDIETLEIIAKEKQLLR